MSCLNPYFARWPFHGILHSPVCIKTPAYDPRASATAGNPSCARFRRDPRPCLPLGSHRHLGTHPLHSIRYDSAVDLISLENVTSSFISTNAMEFTWNSD